MAKNSAQPADRSEQSGGYISIDPGVAIERNKAVITEIRNLVHESQKCSNTSQPAFRPPRDK